MALSPRKFCLDFNDGSVSGSQSAFIAYTIRPFRNGDVERFSITLVEKDTAQPGKLSVLTPTGCTLKIALGIKAAGTSTVYTSVTCAVVGNQFVGDLPLNVAAVAALFAAQTADVNVFLEFELTDSGYPQTLQFSTLIGQQIISTTLADTLPGDRSLGSDEAKGLYVPIAGPASGYSQRIMVDADGSGRRYVEEIYDGAIRYTPLQ